MTELVARIRRISDPFRRRKSFLHVSGSSEVVGTRVDMDSCGFDDFSTLATPLRFFYSPPCPPGSWRFVSEPSLSTVRRSGDCPACFLEPSQHTLTSSLEWLARKQKDAYRGCLWYGECFFSKVCNILTMLPQIFLNCASMRPASGNPPQFFASVVGRGIELLWCQRFLIMKPSSRNLGCVRTRAYRCKPKPAEKSQSARDSRDASRSETWILLQG